MEQQEEKQQENFRVTLKSILGGDILAHNFLRRL